MTHVSEVLGDFVGQVDNSVAVDRSRESVAVVLLFVIPLGDATMNRERLLARCLGPLVAVMIVARLGLPAVSDDSSQSENDGKLRIIAFGAHPDDCEFKIGGTAAKWAALGHHVKLVSVTNGDIGHWQMAGGPLARRERRKFRRPPNVSASLPRCLISTTANSCRLWRTGRRSLG